MVYPKVIIARIMLHRKDLQKEALGIDEDEPIIENFNMHIKVDSIGGLIPVPDDDGVIDFQYCHIILQGHDFIIQYPYKRLCEIMESMNKYE